MMVRLMLCGIECWSINNAHVQKMNIVEMRMLDKCVGILEEILLETKL